MNKRKIHPLVLVILDGWGNGQQEVGNAIALASTPTMDTLLKVYPNTSLYASGTHVGLPSNQVGNSEVGHATIGAGRVLLQDLAKIDQSICDKSFFNKPILLDMCASLRHSGKSIHLIGLCSDGGVHSHINHLIALLDILKQEKIKHIFIHFIADGRDTSPKCIQNFLGILREYLEMHPIATICTISGRYYAMDRDCRWKRTEAFYQILVNDINLEENLVSINDMVKVWYNNDMSDEFIPPTRFAPGTINSGDTVLFFNFRPDRIRQIVQAFVKPEFRGFKKAYVDNLNIITFTEYDGSFMVPIVFPPEPKYNFLGEVLARNQLNQLRIAETEKYAHVTYFFNGGIEEPFQGEDRELIPSPQVNTYDECPSMSAYQVTMRVQEALQKQLYSVIIVNYANPDMLGHTGNLQATVQSVEVVDECIGRLLDSIGQVNGTIIITADHGNAEVMLSHSGQPFKSHTMNCVPFILIEGEGKLIQGHGGQISLRSEGSLVDIAPTILDILNIPVPAEMTGLSLIKETAHEVYNMNTIVLS